MLYRGRNCCIRRAKYSTNLVLLIYKINNTSESNGKRVHHNGACVCGVNCTENLCARGSLLVARAPFPFPFPFTVYAPWKSAARDTRWGAIA